MKNQNKSAETYLVALILIAILSRGARTKQIEFKSVKSNTWKNDGTSIDTVKVPHCKSQELHCKSQSSKSNSFSNLNSNSNLNLNPNTNWKLEEELEEEDMSRAWVYY